MDDDLITKLENMLKKDFLSSDYAALIQATISGLRILEEDVSRKADVIEKFRREVRDHDVRPTSESIDAVYGAGKR